MIFKSISDLSNDIFYKIIPYLPRDIGVVYGVPRSGMLPATIISTILGVKCGVLGGNANIGARGENITLPHGAKALLVDDSIHKGRAMFRAKKIMDSYNIEYYTCSVYAYSLSSELIDYYAEINDNKKIYQWNFSGIKATKLFSWDMDGVICTNPTVYDNDGLEYRREILEGVKPLILPQVKVHSIVTNRIERWRPETVAWLEKYGVQYDNLVMQPFLTATERRAKSNAASFKAEYFKTANSTVFIESSDKQAKKISLMTGKPVLSIEKMVLYGG